MLLRPILTVGQSSTFLIDLHKIRFPITREKFPLNGRYYFHCVKATKWYFYQLAQLLLLILP